MEESDDDVIKFPSLTFFSDGIKRETGINNGEEAEEYGSRFGKGDIVGCGLVIAPCRNSKKPRLFLTVNGVFCECFLYDQLNLLTKIIGKHVVFNVENITGICPFTGLDSVGTSIKANFGQDPQKNPFKYDISKYQVPF